MSKKKAQAAHVLSSRRETQRFTEQMVHISDLVDNLHVYQMSQRALQEAYQAGECTQLARKLIKSLSAIQFVDSARTRLLASRKYLPEDACSWIDSSSTFQSWRNDSHPNFLAIMGGRGTGKFLLSSYIAIRLMEDPIIGKQVIWFHSVLWESETLTPSLILRCLIAQLLQKRPDILANRDRSSYKRRFKAATNMRTLYALFVDIVTKVGRVYIVIDALDSCPNNAVMAESLVQLCESHASVKVLITAMEDPSLGPPLQDVVKIRLHADSVACDVPNYINGQVERNLPHLHGSHPDLAMTVITAAAGNIGWARYIIWGLSQAENDIQIQAWMDCAAKGRDLVYARQYDSLAQTCPLAQLTLIKLILRALLTEDQGLTVNDIHQRIIHRGRQELIALMNTFDQTSWGQEAVLSTLELLQVQRVHFVRQTDNQVYQISDRSLRDYLLNHVPSQRPFVPHLWLPTDTCLLECQLRHSSHQSEYDDGALKHMFADFKEFSNEPGQSVR